MAGFRNLKVVSSDWSSGTQWSETFTVICRKTPTINHFGPLWISALLKAINTLFYVYHKAFRRFGKIRCGVCSLKVVKNSVFPAYWSTESLLDGLSNNSQPLRDLWKGVAVHAQTCPCTHQIKWRIFWAFIMNVGLISSHKSRVTQLGTRIISLLCQL
jgi:hypothetical protein